MGFFGGGSFSGNFMKPASSFAPTDLDNLVLWLDSTDNSTLTTSSTEVTQWADKSASAVSTTDDPSRRPNLSTINSVQSLNFDGSERLNIGNLSVSSGEYTFFWVLEIDDVATATTYLMDSETGRFVMANTAISARTTGYYDGAFRNMGAAYTGAQIMTFNLDSSASAVSMFRDGVEFGNVYTYTENAIGDDTSIGAHYAGASNFYNGDIGDIVGYNAVLAADDRKSVEAYLSEKFNIPVFHSATKIIVCDGDSLTSGSGVENHQNYPYQLRQDYNVWTTFVMNHGTAGATLATMESEASAGIDALAYPEAAHVTLVVMGGYNDIVNDSQTPAQAYARLRTYVQNRVSAGDYDKIVVVTALPAVDTATTTDLFAFNDLIRDGWATELAVDGADELVDTETDTAFDADGDYNDGTNYNADKIHLTATGYGKLADLIKVGVDD